MTPPVTVRVSTPDDRAWIEDLLVESWGGSVIAFKDGLIDAGSLPALVTHDRNGLLTFQREPVVEIVTLNAIKPRRGIGTALVERLCAQMRNEGVDRVEVTTTNDNLDALRFYQRRGFRLSSLRCGAVDVARRQKLTIPAEGAYGIPIRDELTLVRRL